MVFRSRAAVAEAIHEFALVQKNFVQNAFFANLGVENWTIHPSVPQHDLIWHNIRYVLRTQPGLRFYASAAPLLISSLLTAGLIILELVLCEVVPRMAPYLLYFTSLATVFLTIRGIPWLVFYFLNKQRYYLKTRKEESFAGRLGTALFLSLVIVPISCGIVISILS